MRLDQLLASTCLRRARVVTSLASCEREVTTVHTLDHPDIIQWSRAGQLLLITGVNWPQELEKQQLLVTQLAAQGVSGVLLAVPRFLPQFPAASVEAANQAGLPLLEAPWGLSFTRITEEVLSAILDQRSALLQRSLRIHKALSHAVVRSHSLSELANALSKLIERSAYLLGAHGEIMAAGPPESRDPACIARRSEEATRLVKSISTSHVTDEDGQPITGREYGVVCPIYLRSERVGTVWIPDNDPLMYELDLRAAEHAAMIAALQLSLQRQLLEQEVRLGYAFLDSLLEGRFERSSQVLERARLMGFDDSLPYRLCIVMVNAPVPLTPNGFQRREQAVEDIRRRLLALNVQPIMSVSSNLIHFLLPETLAPSRIWDGAESKPYGMATSRPFVGLEQVRRAGLDALSVLPYVRPGDIKSFDEALLPRVLHGDQEARNLFLHQILSPLGEGDRGDRLAQTLYALVEAGFHQRQAAQGLGIHLNTLRYRMARIETLTGLDLGKHQDRFRLQLATQLADMETLNGEHAGR